MLKNYEEIIDMQIKELESQLSAATSNRIDMIKRLQRITDSDDATKISNELQSALGDFENTRLKTIIIEKQIEVLQLIKRFAEQK